ncbi:nucleotide sugar dehydrogenase [Luminiphilus sp.]|nr:nucleotide sugar dehydrogenase [Luminiphilus sp.]
MGKQKKIAIIGLGYVGLPLAVEFGKSRPVIGFDSNPDRVDELLAGVDSTLEVGSEALADSVQLEVTVDSLRLQECSVFIITVPTPIDEVNRPDLSLLISASETVGGALKSGDIVIYESTVYPGCTEEICVPVLEEISALTFNKDFFCGYSPERINPGDKVNTLRTIVKITSGSNAQVADEIDRLYASIIDAGTFRATSIMVAEAAKVIENSQRDLNIAFVNELSLIFNVIGIDTIDVLEAAGTKWNFLPFRPGMVGGHCIGVDPYYLTHKAEQVGYEPQVLLAGRRINDDMARLTALSIVKKMALNGIDVSKSTVAIFGVTFKNDCPDIRNSKVFELVDEFESWGVNVILIDPWANKGAVSNIYQRELIEFSSDLNFDSVVVSVGHEVFKTMDLNDLRSTCRSARPVFADLKAIFSRETLEEKGFTVVRL